MLVAHPVISLLVQFLELRGKTGKVRKRVGNVASDEVPRGITIPCAEPTIVTAADGTRTATAQPLIDSSFDLLRFRRALHHVAFNTLALRDGVERAHEAAFDPVRRYVRAPRRGESWPYAQYVDLSKGLAKDVTLILLRDPITEYVGIILGRAVAFAVDLMNAGRLQEVVDRHFPTGAIVVDAVYVPSKPTEGPGGRKYRLTVMLDE